MADLCSGFCVFPTSRYPFLRGEEDVHAVHDLAEVDAALLLRDDRPHDVVRDERRKLRGDVRDHVRERRLAASSAERITALSSSKVRKM